jgi:glycerol-3-phosphate dehydrogenase
LDDRTFVVSLSSGQTLSRPPETQVAVIGGGVVGCAVTYTLAGRGVAATLFEAETELARAASGTNSGILHTGFDSYPGELETSLILRAAELRDPVLDRLGVPVIRCGAVLRPADDAEARVVAEIEARAQANGVEVALGPDGALSVPGETVTDPVAYTRGLAAAAESGGAELRLGARVAAIETSTDLLALRTAGGEALRCAMAVNCAGLRADEVARMVGDSSFEIYPRKGEFFVFDAPGGRPLDRILLPVPSKRTKGVLVFPTVDGMVIAGPTAHDQEDKDDWSVRGQAFEEVMPKASAMLPALAGAEPAASYAGLRPAGRGSNYVVEASRACPRLIHAAAIRSTGLTASLGIAERVIELLAEAGLDLAEAGDLEPAEPVVVGEPWWRRAARRGATV